MELQGEWVTHPQGAAGPIHWSGPSRYNHTATMAGKPVAFVERRGPGRGLWVGRIDGWRWYGGENVAADLAHLTLPVKAFGNLREAKREIERILLGGVTV
jgi:hypothetical protein